MEPKSSKDLPPSPPRKDEQRDRERVAIQDADKTDQRGWNSVHGDGEEIGLDKA